jgi:hypothetical protein
VPCRAGPQGVGLLTGMPEPQGGDADVRQRQRCIGCDLGLRMVRVALHE